MKRNVKRFLAYTLALVLLFGMMPTMAIAEYQDVEETGSVMEGEAGNYAEPSSYEAIYYEAIYYEANNYEASNYEAGNYEENNNEESVIDNGALPPAGGEDVSANENNSEDDTLYIVTFYDFDQNIFNTQEVRAGDTATRPSIDPPLPSTEPQIPSSGFEYEWEFLGWFTDGGTSFNFNTAVEDDINLYARFDMTAADAIGSESAAYTMVETFDEPQIVIGVRSLRIYLDDYIIEITSSSENPGANNVDHFHISVFCRDDNTLLYNRDNIPNDRPNDEFTQFVMYIEQDGIMLTVTFAVSGNVFLDSPAPSVEIEDLNPPEPGPWTVELSENGGHFEGPANILNQTIPHGGLVQEPTPEPTFDEYELLGWFTALEGGRRWNFDEDVVTEDMMLFARWGQTDEPPIMHTVTFEAGLGGGFEGATSPVVFDNIDDGTTWGDAGIIIPTPVANDGYFFAGWLLNDDSIDLDDFDANSLITGNMTFTATFEPGTMAIVRFPGVENVRVWAVVGSDDWRIIDSSLNNESGYFVLPEGTTQIRAQKMADSQNGPMVYDFRIVDANWPAPNEDGVLEFNVPIIPLDVTGLLWQNPRVGVLHQRNWVRHVALVDGDSITLYVFDNGRDYTARLQNTGFHAVDVVAERTADGDRLVADFSKFFYTIEVPDWASNVNISSNGWIINNAGSGTVIELVKTYRDARISFVVDGTTIQFYFLLDGTCPFTLRPFTVEHWLQGIDGEYRRDDALTQTRLGVIGTEVTAARHPDLPPGFVENVDHIDRVYYGGIDADVSLSLVLRLFYSRTTHIVTFEAGANGSFADGEETVFENILFETPWGDAVTVPIPVPNAGYFFQGWELDGAPIDLPDVDDAIIGDMTFTAVFSQRIPITITANDQTRMFTGHQHTLANLFTVSLPDGVTLPADMTLPSVSGLTAVSDGVVPGDHTINIVGDPVLTSGGIDVTDVTDRFAVTLELGTLTIDQRQGLQRIPIIVTANSEMHRYTGLPHTVGGDDAFTALWTGGQPADATLMGLTVSEVSRTVPGATPVRVSGDGQVLIGYDDVTANYMFIRVPGLLTVRPLLLNERIPITVSANSEEHEFTGQSHTVNGWEVSPELPGTAEFVGVASGSGTFPGTPYPVVFTDNGRIIQDGVDVTRNFRITRETGTLTITQRAVTLTANSFTKVEGTADPTFTAAVTAGSVVPGHPLNYTISRVAGEAPGTYAITITPGSNPNYAITTVAGTLTITAAPAADPPTTDQPPTDTPPADTPPTDTPAADPAPVAETEDDPEAEDDPEEPEDDPEEPEDDTDDPEDEPETPDEPTVELPEPAVPLAPGPVGGDDIDGNDGDDEIVIEEPAVPLAPIIGQGGQGPSPLLWLLTLLALPIFFLLWWRRRRTVEYITGFSDEPHKEKVRYGSYLDAPDKLIPSSYNIKGWFLDNEFKEAWNFEKDKIKKNIQLFVKLGD